MLRSLLPAAALIALASCSSGGAPPAPPPTLPSPLSTPTVTMPPLPSLPLAPVTEAEAAAATAVLMAPQGAPPRPEPPPREFRADHPFPFLLRDLRSGAILFAGRVEDPRAR